MKKHLYLLMAFTLLLSLCACGNSKQVSVTPNQEEVLESETAEPTAVPETEEKGTLWGQSYYVDNFNQPTDETFICNTVTLVGTFSNSATTNSALYANVLVDGENIAIMLYEYGQLLVKNSSTQYDEQYDIQMKTVDGTIIDMTGYIYAGDDKLVIDASNRDAIIKALSSEPVNDIAFVSFYIMQTEQPTTTYLLSVPMSNFADIFASVFSLT
ncbi:MAG: hypothetical protein KBI01_06035 [Oscillospiraceae bacterium]|nr:hypothetical protein [Oscillospiraceae bacterium]